MLSFHSAVGLVCLVIFFSFLFMAIIIAIYQNTFLSLYIITSPGIALYIVNVIFYPYVFLGVNGSK